MTVFVVDTSTQEGSICRTVLGYRNALNANIFSGYADADYPASLMFDDSYHTEFSPDLTIDPTSQEIIFYFSGVEQLNYFMINSKNASSCGLSVNVEAYLASTGAYETVAGFGSMTDGKPVMVYFGGLFASGYADAIRLRVTLTYSSKPYIMTMMCGSGIVFPRTFSLGFQPPYAAYLDEVEQFEADDGLNVTAGRRLARGKQLKGSINFVRMTTIKEFWNEFANHVLDSKTLCMLWNTELPDEAIYGIQNPTTLTKPSYKNPLFGQLDFEVAGWA